jgi:hypothetical protein
MPKVTKDTASTVEQMPGYEGRFEAGEVYYAAPGHTPVLTAGTEIIEFSPADKLHESMEFVSRNAAATLGSS